MNRDVISIIVGVVAGVSLTLLATLTLPGRNETVLSTGATPHKVVHCSACGRSMTTHEGVTFEAFGLTISASSLAPDTIHEIYPELPGEAEYHICWVCWLRSQGVTIPVHDPTAVRP